jgi:hypothetical protein
LPELDLIKRMVDDLITLKQPLQAPPVCPWPEPFGGGDSANLLRSQVQAGISLSCCENLHSIRVDCISAPPFQSFQFREPDRHASRRRLALPSVPMVVRHTFLHCAPRTHVHSLQTDTVPFAQPLIAPGDRDHARRSSGEIGSLNAPTIAPFACKHIVGALQNFRPALI